MVRSVFEQSGIAEVSKSPERREDSVTGKPPSQQRWKLLRRVLPILFVWGTWTAMVGAALAFVHTYGSNVPSWDGWDMVPTLTGHQPVSAKWLWSQHNEHRVPLPRLLLLGLHGITGINFRTPMFFNIAVTAALALAMILSAKRLRGGQLRYTDAFFPLIFLHWGHAANMIWGWQLQFYTSMALSGTALLLIVQSGPSPKPRNAAFSGSALFCFPCAARTAWHWCPPLALWLGYFAIFQRRSGDLNARRASLPTLGLAVGALVLSALYLFGWERVPFFGFGFGLWSITTAAKVGAMGFGPGLAGLDLQLRPMTLWPIPCLFVLCFLAASVALLLRSSRDRPQERQRALGLLSFLTAMGCLALALGLGRNAFETRYVILLFPTWCCVYFVWSIYAPPLLNTSARTLLLALTLVTLWPNTRFGIDYGTDVRSQLASFEREMEAGVPSYRLIFRYWHYLHPHQDILNEYMPMLREAGVGSFRYLQDNPTFREVPVPLVPRSVNQVRWNGGTAYATGHGNESYMLFSLPKAEYVYGIRLKYTYRNEDDTLPFVFLYWRDDADKEFGGDRYGNYSATGDHANWVRGTWGQTEAPESTLTLWVCDTVKDIRIHPDLRPGVFTLSELVLLAPPADQPHRAEE